MAPSRGYHNAQAHRIERPTAVTRQADNPPMAPFVQTVLGRIDPTALGFTLPHEHTRCVLWQIPARWDYWELTGEDELILPELTRFRELGGTCLADLTLQSIGRDPARLRRLAEASGLHLVMGCGWYREAYYPAEALIDRRSVGSLADEIVREFEEGAEGTDVRPGIIGEIGTDKPWVSAQEERVFRAVARASRVTGMAVITHAVMSPVGLEQLRIMEDAGVDPARVVVGHADSYPDLDHYERIFERGASIELDFLGMSFTPQERMGEARLIPLLLAMLASGREDRILLSQDVCHNSQLRHYDGNGYTYLQETFLPRLREAGVGETEIHQITVENPRRILAIGGQGHSSAG
jgi:phosphotriesterase-related protein